MKKLLLLLSAIVVFACFVSCGNNEEPSEQIPEEYDFVFVWNINNQYDSIKETISTDLGSDSISSSGKKFTTEYTLTKEQKEEIRNILNTIDFSKISGEIKSKSNNIEFSTPSPYFELTIISDTVNTTVFGEFWLLINDIPVNTGWTENDEEQKIFNACEKIAKILEDTKEYKSLEIVPVL